MSTPTSTTEFVDLVRQSGIIPAREFNQFLAAINDPPQSPSRLAAVLTGLSGWDYFRKAMPHILRRER